MSAFTASRFESALSLALLFWVLGQGTRPCFGQAEAPPPDEGALLTHRMQDNERRLVETRQSDAQITKMLAPIREPAEDAVNTMAANNQNLRRHLLGLEKALAEYQAAHPAMDLSIGELERQLSDLDRERDRLVTKQAALSVELAQTNSGKGLRRELLLENIEPINLKLVKNRVVPMMEPFYTVRRGKLKEALSGRTVDGMIISRVHDGEAAGNAIRPGGLLDTLISKADARQKYFRLWVCADSIAAFQALSEAISKRGFVYSWDTAKDEDIVRRAEQGPQTNQVDRGYFPSNHKL